LNATGAGSARRLALVLSMAWSIVGLAGCGSLGVEPSGKLACGTHGHECPSGYVCNLSDNRCWRAGTQTVDGGPHDMGVDQTVGDAPEDMEPIDADQDDPQQDAPKDMEPIDADQDAPPQDGGTGVCSSGATRTCDRDGKMGRCASGTELCSGGQWGPCSIAPAAADRCDMAGDDSNCDGKANDGCTCTNGATQPCGPAMNQGLCKQGTQTCGNSAWGACTGAVYAKPRDCTSSTDNDCDGKPDNTIDNVCQCGPVNGIRTCGTHPQDGIGACKAGSQTCTAGAGNSTTAWGACGGSVGPAASDTCQAGDDSNCNGVKNEGCMGAKLLVTSATGSASFGSVAVGSMKNQVFTVTNAGQLASSAVTLTMTGAGFAIAAPSSGDCVSGSTTLAPGGTCTVHVIFTPTTGGPHSGLLTANATTGGVDQLALTGDSPAYCGDTIVSPPEDCDLGTAKNTGAYGGCKSNCTFGPRCGDGTKDSVEDCDRGTLMNTGAYGGCTSMCKSAPYCGDGTINGPETCDNGASNGFALNACNPECSGTVGVKLLKVTAPVAPTFGGVTGADSLCVTAFGTGYKAVFADATTRIPSSGGVPTGMGQKNWTLKKFTLYRNGNNEDVFTTDGAALLGIRGGAPVALINSIYGYSGEDPKQGINAWSATDHQWNYSTGYDCLGFTSTSAMQFSGSIYLFDTEPTFFPNANGVTYCSALQRILCAQQ